MRTEVRFLLAIGLMLGVLVGTEYLFPREEPPVPAVLESTGGEAGPGSRPGEPGVVGELPTTAVPGRVPVDPEVSPGAVASPEVPERTVVVEGPLYRFSFSNMGARLTSAQLVRFRSLRTDGPVELVPSDGIGSFGRQLEVNGQMIDLRGVPFEIDPPNGLTLSEGESPQSLSFTYRDPSSSLSLEVVYTFDPDSYLMEVRGRVNGVNRAALVTDLARGIAFNEADSVPEARMMAFVTNHLEEGIDSRLPSSVETSEVVVGPLIWAAYKSKFFMIAVLPESGEYLGGVLADPDPIGVRANIAVTHPVRTDGTFSYRAFVGPLEYATLSALGDDLEQVNPYGWKFLRPLLNLIVPAIMWVLNFLHDNLRLAYGWVLILFGVLMRILLWPVNQKMMRSQMKNMAVQPLMKEVQTKYKDDPQRLQKEMMKLYKEHGFNPLGGCLPMLLPWPVLIALFFVFQNTIELRGVAFLWLPDLSAKDPLYILPVFMAASMYLLQRITFKSMDQSNSQMQSQMKMMMYGMPLFFAFIFMNFASGLNLYYATANIATIPQQLLIAKERRKAQAAGPPKPASEQASAEAETPGKSAKGGRAGKKRKKKRSG